MPVNHEGLAAGSFITGLDLLLTLSAEALGTMYILNPWLRPGIEITAEMIEAVARAQHDESQPEGHDKPK